jgi:hypothetical protein
VDLDLECASPEKFKDKSLSNCEGGCVDYNTDFADNAEKFRMNEYVLPDEVHENNEIPFLSYFNETQVKVQKFEHYYTPTFIYTSVVLAVVFLCLFTAVAFLLCRLIFLPSPRNGSANSDPEACPLESPVKKL